MSFSVSKLKTMFGDGLVETLNQHLGSVDFTTDEALFAYHAMVLFCNGKSFAKDALDKEVSRNNSHFNRFISNMMTDVDIHVNTHDGLNPELTSLYALMYVLGGTIWSMSSKAVYKFDSNFAKHFITTENLRLYPLDFLYLPCNCFYIDISAIQEFQEINIDGVNVSIIRIEDENSNGFYIDLQFVYNINIATTPVYLSIMFDDCEYENGLLYYDYVKQYASGAVKIEDNSMFDPAHYDKLDSLILLVLNFLSYITCKKPDIQVSKTTFNQKKRAERMKKTYTGVNEYEVGVRYGKAISLYTDKVRNEYEESKKRSSGARKPHLVKAHWHGYWVGKGRTEFQYLWVAPYFQGKGDIDVVIQDCVEVDRSKYSQGEELLYYLLLHNNIPFTKQKYIPKTGKYYDCCAVIDGLDVFIEFDGQQHFRPVKNWDFNRTVTSDTEKNNYCKEHNIPLVRIRYDQKLILDDIVNDIISDPTKYLHKMNPFLTDEEYYSIRK